MVQLPLIFDDSDNEETKPLPLIVAQRWDFPLAHVQTETGMVYAVQDWMRGLSGEEDVRTLLSKMRQTNPHLESLFRKFPYKASNNKIYQLPYTDEDSLIFILVYNRLSRGRSRLAEIRNFLANHSPKYEHLRCREVKNKVTLESEFQRELIKAFSLNFDTFEAYPYYQTPLEKVVDILIRGSQTNYLLIECKVNSKDFYKALGQLIAYQAELSQTILNINWILAVAMPYEIIDDYMKKIVSKLPIHLISIVNEIVIDVVTGEPLAKIIGRQAEETSLLMEMDLATGKALLKG